MKEIVLQYFPGQRFDYVEPRAGDVMLTKADLSKFKSHGWYTKVGLKEGLHAVFERLRKELS